MGNWRRDPRPEPPLCEHFDFDPSGGFEALFRGDRRMRCDEPAVASYATTCSCGEVHRQFFLCEKHRAEQEQIDRENAAVCGP